MSEIPTEAVQAATRMLKNEILTAESDEALVRLILQAAAPLIAKQERRTVAEEIARQIESCIVVSRTSKRTRAWAAEIAREAFPKGDDQ